MDLLVTRLNVHKAAKKFFTEPVKNATGSKIIQQLKDEKKKTLTDIISKSEIIDKLSKWF